MAATRIEGIGPAAIRCDSAVRMRRPLPLPMAIRSLSTTSAGRTYRRQAGSGSDGEGRGAADGDLPDASIQNPILTFAPADLVAVATRLRPFLGQLGTTPVEGDAGFAQCRGFRLVPAGAPHVFALTREELARHKTDGHLDVNTVREGAVLICPVKVAGGGIYMGDMHAFQGDGEIAGHTCDVAGTATLEVHVIKGLTIDGPILFPRVEDLPYLARPLTAGREGKRR